MNNRNNTNITNSLNGLINSVPGSGGGDGGSPAQSITTQQAQKRPMNAFLIFCKRHRSVVRQKYPRLENRAITKLLGEWWAALDADEKHNYTDLARQYKEAFMKANPNFKWYKTDLKPPPPQNHAAPSASSQQSSSLQQLPLSTPSMSSAVAPAGKTVKSPPSFTGPTTVVPTSHSSSAAAAAVPSGSSSKDASDQPLTNGPSTLSPTSAACGRTGSTPKPPKKRYLESLESNSDYSKGK